jgi:hypothetical protein
MAAVAGGATIADDDQPASPARRRRGFNRRWTVAFLIGLATVTATGFGWRAAQIGSTAAFDDRQSIGETVRVEQAAVQRTIALEAAARASASVGRRFDRAGRERALVAQQTTALDAPAALNPDRWASEADAIRVRINGLTHWAFVALLAVPLFTLAQLATRTKVVVLLVAAGLVVYLTGLVAGLTTQFWA